MPRASGVYSLPSGNPIPYLSQASSSLFNAALADIAAALDATMWLDGTAAATGNWNMNSHLIQSLSAPGTAGDALSWGAAGNLSTLTVTGALTGQAATFSSTVGITGALTGTSASFSTTLGVTGLSTLTGGLTTPANVTTTGSGALSIAGTAGITGAATLSSTLAVTGLSTLTGGLTTGNNVTTTGTGALSIAGTGSIGGLLTATGGITTATGNIAITSSGQFTGPGTGLTGTAANLTAGSVTTTSSSTSLPYSVPFIYGNAILYGGTFTFNPNTSTLTAGTFAGSGSGLTGTAGSLTAGTATTANALNASNSYSGVNFTASGYFSGPGTNLTGTAASLTAGTATSANALNTGNTYTIAGLTINGYTNVPASAVTSTATTTLNCTTSNFFYVTMGASITTLTINNAHDGQVVNVRFKQPASGGPYTVAWPASFRWNGGLAPALSTAASAEDMLSMQYSSTDSTWVASLLKGVQ